MMQVEKLWAWVATAKDGSEGVCGFVDQILGTVPLIGADQARIESLRGKAQLFADGLGFPVQLVEFSTRRVIEDLSPGGRP